MTESCNCISTPGFLLRLGLPDPTTIISGDDVMKFSYLSIAALMSAMLVLSIAFAVLNLSAASATDDQVSPMPAQSSLDR